MAKTLKQLLSKQKQGSENFASPTKDEVKFIDKHEVEVVADAAGNGDDVFKGTNVKTVKRSSERHGYDSPEDEAVHEGVEAHGQFVKVHSDIAKTMKELHKGLMDHYNYVTNKKNHNQGVAHWGHVGTAKDIHRQLQDLKDKILEQGEYMKPVNVKEDAELEEKTLTKAEMKKREEVARAIERENPDMPMAKKMAIATATAKKVAEETTIEEDLIDLYFALDEDARDYFIDLLNKGTEEELLEFVESLEGENG